MEEIWRPVKGYEGYYSVSNLGRVRGERRKAIRKSSNGHNTGDYYTKEHILPQQTRKPPCPMPYRVVKLSKDGVRKGKVVHRLVAEAFCEKPDGCDVVNHIDNNPQNNVATNLEWTTTSGNMSHAVSQGRMSLNGVRKMQELNKKPVERISENGEIKRYNSAKEAAQDVGAKNPVSISQACNGKIKTSFGYKWRYV